MKNFLLFITLWEDHHGKTIILRNHHVNVVEVHSLIHSNYDLNYKWIEYISSELVNETDQTKLIPEKDELKENKSRFRLNKC